MVLLMITLLSLITYNYNNRPLFDIRGWRCSMHRRQSITPILIVYAHPVSKMTISTSVCGAQHPNADQIIQQAYLAAKHRMAFQPTHSTTRVFLVATFFLFWCIFLMHIFCHPNFANFILPLIINLLPGSLHWNLSCFFFSCFWSFGWFRFLRGWWIGSCHAALWGIQFVGKVVLGLKTTANLLKRGFC